MLNLNLTFNDFTYCSGPPTTMDLRFKDKCKKLLTHNNNIIVHYVRSTNVALCDNLFKGKVKIKTDLAAIMKMRCDYTTMMNRGACISLQKSESTQNDQPLWIHHAFLLQFIHPKVNSKLNEGIKIASNDDASLSKFMTNLKIRHVCNDSSTGGTSHMNLFV
jgi:hypothetical protein